MRGSLVLIAKLYVTEIDRALTQLLAGGSKQGMFSQIESYISLGCFSGEPAVWHMFGLYQPRTLCGGLAVNVWLCINAWGTLLCIGSKVSSYIIVSS